MSSTAVVFGGPRLFFVFRSNVSGRRNGKKFAIVSVWHRNDWMLLYDTRKDVENNISYLNSPKSVGSSLYYANASIIIIRCGSENVTSPQNPARTKNDRERTAAEQKSKQYEFVTFLFDESRRHEIVPRTLPNNLISPNHLPGPTPRIINQTSLIRTIRARVFRNP